MATNGGRVKDNKIYTDKDGKQYMRVYKSPKGRIFVQPRWIKEYIKPIDTQQITEK